MKVGTLIKEALEREGRSQKWLAEQVGVTQTQVSAWVRSDNLRTSSLRRINNVLYVPEFAALLGEDTGRDRNIEQLLAKNPHHLKAILALIDTGILDTEKGCNTMLAYAEFLMSNTTPPERDAQ